MDPLRGSIVFIVEDSEVVSSVFKEILERQHFKVIVMEMAAAARQYLESCVSPPDVILLDLDLPDSEPDQTVELIQRWRNLAPVIVISSAFSQERVLRCERLGAHSCYEKTDLTGPDTLISAVRSAISGHRLNRKMNELCFTAGKVHGLLSALCQSTAAENRG